MSPAGSSNFWFVAALLLCCSAPALAQSKVPGDVDSRLSPPDTPEQSTLKSHNLAGDPDGERGRLEEKGFSFDLAYISDSLSDVRSAEPARFTSFSRVRGTVDLDLGKLIDARGFTFHATGVWQTGANLGNYLGAFASPSALATFNAFRLDAWWLEKRGLSGRIAFRAGQFAGLDSYGSQHYGGSFIAQSLGYALTSVGNTNATFQPFATPAAELRVAPLKHLYIRSEVLAGDPMLTTRNLSGFALGFHGYPVSLSEIGWTPGRRASEIQTDTVSDRRGYTGLYKFGAAYNPGKFQSTNSLKPTSGNYTIYGMTSQALWRTHHDSGVGPDITGGISYGPPDRNRNNSQLTLGLRYNELLPIHFHNTVSFGYLRTALSSRFPITPAAPFAIASQSAENLLELNTLITLPRGIVVQPVVQRFLDLGATNKPATLLGFRVKLSF